MPHTCRRRSHERAGWNVQQLLESGILSALFRLGLVFFFLFNCREAIKGKCTNADESQTQPPLQSCTCCLGLKFFDFRDLKPDIGEEKKKEVPYWNPRKTQLWKNKKCNVIINKCGDDISVYFRIFYTVCCDSDLGNIKEIHSQSASFGFIFYFFLSFISDQWSKALKNGTFKVTEPNQNPILNKRVFEESKEKQIFESKRKDLVGWWEMESLGPYCGVPAWNGKLTAPQWRPVWLSRLVWSFAGLPLITHLHLKKKNKKKNNWSDY